MQCPGEVEVDDAFRVQSPASEPVHGAFVRGDGVGPIPGGLQAVEVGAT